jgi:hypothetical protein
MYFFCRGKERLRKRYDIDVQDAMVRVLSTSEDVFLSTAAEFE